VFEHEQWGWMMVLLTEVREIMGKEQLFCGKVGTETHLEPINWGRPTTKHYVEMKSFGNTSLEGQTL
jgi:hypothetical protein